MRTIETLAKELSSLGCAAEANIRFEVQPIPGAVEVLKIIVEDCEELPIFISMTDSQILCISYLWKTSEVLEEKKAEMVEEMLEMNIPMPLSSFAKVGDQYVVYGALSVKAHIDEVVLELEMLSTNSIAVIQEMASYLK